MEGEGRAGSLPHQRLRVWHAAMDFVKMVHAEPPGDAELRDQAKRAAKSVALGIAEGAALEGAMKVRHYRIARASAEEVVGAYELAKRSAKVSRASTSRPSAPPSSRCSRG